ncbi:MAG: ribosome small subunit-dependent GTPase A, partial [Spirochaetaceae bacterium]|nr:ribosome small subunit-dependent GTPase A [Spirochaetaceae bacterium]
MSDLLTLYGSQEFFVREALLYPELYIGRIISGHKKLYTAVTSEGELLAEVSGKYRYQAAEAAADESSAAALYPAVGDFVMLDRLNDSGGNGIIHRVLPRKSVFMRKAPGQEKGAQVIAANIDTICICMAVNYDYNLRRLERYLSIAWESGALPVVVLTKADLAADIAGLLEETALIAVGADVIAVSDRIEGSWEQLYSYVVPGKTIAFTGSSGVGKSTLINRLAGREIADTRELGVYEKGRHTTSRRDLILLPGGGLVIDTPGMRELGLETADLCQSFADIEALASRCRF